MSTTPFHLRSARTLTVLGLVLVAAGCTDAAGPSSTSGAAAGAAPAQLPVDGSAPAELNLPVPGDHAESSSSSLSALLITNASFDPRYTSSLPYVFVPTGSATCASGLGIRYVNVRGINVSATGSNLLWSQSVAEEVWLYRSNGTSWVYVGGRRIDTSLGVTQSFATIKDADIFLNTGGIYRVVVRFTWFANGGAGWVTTATKTYDFNGQAEYSAIGGVTTGVGYCKIN